MSCTRTVGCPGSVDETGYCDRCGLSPVPPPVAADQPDRSQVSRSAARDSWTVASLVSLPVLTFAPDQAVTQSLRVPEEARFCAKGHPVGRGRAGRPGLDEGFCPRCRTPFSFLPGLRPGVVVADRYQVVRCLARGGQGWIYLAKDTHQDHIEVALKGVLHANDEKALAAAVQERQFLNSLDHPNIVRSIDFALHDDPVAGPTGYIVMDYLDGMSLRRLLSAAKDPRQPDVTLPLDHILAYGHEILAALDYLHRRGLLYTDMKPDNVMRTADRVKVIDLGGVRREDGGCAGLVGSPDFLVSMEELQTRGATARSDLFALGRTLAELFAYHTPGPGTPGAARDALGVESFRRLVARATHPDWNRRFATASEMSEQLLGVLREIVAGGRDQRQPEPVSLFQPSARLLDTGLGLVPPLHTWTAEQDHPVLPDGCPTARAVALGLPVPRPDPDDPAAGELATIDAPDAQSLLNKLATVRQASVEVELGRCRAHLELADPRSAVDALTAATALLGVRAAADWRLTWHRALLALAGDRIDEAAREFDAVYADIPGEIAPKLALGYCAERDGDGVRATRYYAAVWRRDPFQASAAFGLARLRLAATDRAGAVAILDEVPALSRHHDAARIAAVRVLSSRLASGLPGAGELNQAVRRLALLHLDGGERHGESRDRLTAAIREVALDLIRSGNASGLVRGPALGVPPTERGVRELLDRSYRALAQQADQPEDHHVLIDRANAVRPRTRW
ncbi:serine/threonine protein kinase, bacterial [Micromonospora zingiberis]|uniref:non-specific serine/threonine protein kinase n=1 Tax=Micromonospora zingiberis TaxID=2053011 RepID=A0A4R0GRL8_9ACTN|nr:serine/threonine-protein kinase [Micromonospora zingiberis]TCC00297.1 serine/threonine protein kinase, bacterial [Micromonospora zingiberis]